MKILVIGKFYTEGFALHIAETLVDMGHVVSRFEPGYKSINSNWKIGRRINQIKSVIYTNSDSLPAIRAKRMRSLWQLLETTTPDIIIVCHDFLWPEEVRQLKLRSHAKVVMWFPDALSNFGKGYFMNAPYDALFFKDPFIVKSLSGVLASPVYYLPECFNPKRHYLPEGEVLDSKYNCDITTAGNSHSWRVAFYKHLEQYHVKLWGQHAPLWMPSGAVSNMYQKQLVLNEDKARAFLGAKIVLNNLHYAEIWGLNVRTFEAAGIGAFQMVNWRPGLKQLFEDGKELVSFCNMDDMQRKIAYWITRPEERQAIAAAGKKRAYAEHTYALRLTMLLDILESTQVHAFPLPIILS